ncbi:MAG: GGDEF domain-containing protein [Sandaracinaceae bacterium]|nr:GGDEF domain-containing protein [Sandaracinaceae bacterium]
MARLSYALSHVLRLFRMASAASGTTGKEIVPLEEALSRAQMPEDYIEVARSVVQLQAPPAGAAQGISHSIHGQFVQVMRELARALTLPKLEAEIRELGLTPADKPIDPGPLLEVGRRLVASVLVHQSTTEVLDEALKNVDGGIRRLAEEEAVVENRVVQVRQSLQRGDQAAIEDERRNLLAAASALETLVQERREALLDLQRTSRIAQRRAERLLSALADATSAALTDPLTGLSNRRALNEAVARIAARPTVTGILALDLDHFKRINDTFGHAGGDRVLVFVSDILRAEIRGDDAAFRVGGEELLVLLADCDAAGALATAERIRDRIARNPVPMPGGKGVQVTTSIGATLWGAGASFESRHDLADEALYQAKTLGRNRTVVL